MNEEKTLKEATLCFPVHGDKVLLGMKLLKIGAGRWNGWGGGIEPGEMPIEAIIRELMEESGGVIARPEAFVKVAVNDFRNHKRDGSEFICRVHTYLLTEWQGNFLPTLEIDQPTWFRKSGLPLSGMMPADRVWLPLVLSGKKILGFAEYTPFQQEMIGDMRIEFVDDLAA